MGSDSHFPKLLFDRKEVKTIKQKRDGMIVSTQSFRESAMERLMTGLLKSNCSANNPQRHKNKKSTR